jgi:micrococcal nuclease
VAGAGALAAVCWAHAIIDDRVGTDPAPRTRAAATEPATRAHPRATEPAIRTPAAAHMPATATPRRDHAAPGRAMLAVVLRVVDGDTVVLRILGRRVPVRIIGMDAPETWLRHDCFGAEATRALRRLTPPGSRVYAAGDVEPYDRYGRRLLYLWTARGAFVEETLVRAGYARAMAVPPDTGHAAVLREAEDTARRAGAGRWSACRQGRGWRGWRDRRAPWEPTRPAGLDERRGT